MDPQLSPQGGPVSGGEMTIFEGHLEKISDILAKWERRYFILSRTNIFDSSSVELAYYKDSEKKAKQKKTINLTLVTNVSPVQKPGSKEYVFALDVAGKHVLLKASSQLLQNIWVCKLLECCSKDRLTYHVTVPAQPMSSYLEALIKLAAQTQVAIVSPVNGAKLVSIDFDKIRRFGCEILVDYDIIWFETCGCKGTIEQFFWFSVPSGIEAAHIILQDIKKSVELTVRSFLIQEEGNKDSCQTIYISRPHYGCSEYPVSMRQRILQNSLMSLATSPRCEAASLMNRIDRTRLSSGTFVGVVPTPGDARRESGDARRRTLGSQQNSGGIVVSPVVSPRGSPSPQGRPTPLDQLKCNQDLSKSASHGDFDSGVNMEEGLDQSRHSAPSTYNVLDVPPSKQPLSTMGKRMSLDEVTRSSRPLLQKQRRAGTTTATMKLSVGMSGGGRRLSNFSSPGGYSLGRDSANGSVGDLLEENEHSIKEEGGRYNHLAPAKPTGYDSRSLPGRSKSSSKIPSVNAYDHLSESYSGMSLKNSLGREKKQKTAYVMS